MRNLRNLFTIVLLGVFCSCGAVGPNEATAGADKGGEAETKPEAQAKAQWLFVAHSASATLAGTTLTLQGADESLIAFTDRPVRKSGRSSWAALAKSWAEGKDSFQADPPNAVLAGEVQGADGKKQHCSLVVEIVAAPEVAADASIALTVKVLRREPGCGTGGAADELAIAKTYLSLDGLCFFWNAFDSCPSECSFKCIHSG